MPKVPKPFQSTRPARGATFAFLFWCNFEFISIHAPREGRDTVRMEDANFINEFQSTRPARGATGMFGKILVIFLFQSTRPARGATCFGAVVLRVLINFNPRAPRGARHYGLVRRYVFYYFNPRAPRGARLRLVLMMFLIRNFNPRAPRGARQSRRLPIQVIIDVFQSTRPARGATRELNKLSRTVIDFNPRAPRGARRFLTSSKSNWESISIHAPREGRDSSRLPIQEIIDVFQSTRPARGATCRHAHIISETRNFNPRAPRGARRRFCSME